MFGFYFCFGFSQHIRARSAAAAAVVVVAAHPIAPRLNVDVSIGGIWAQASVFSLCHKQNSHSSQIPSVQHASFTAQHSPNAASTSATERETLSDAQNL